MYFLKKSIILTLSSERFSNDRIHYVIDFLKFRLVLRKQYACSTVLDNGLSYQYILLDEFST